MTAPFLPGGELEATIQISGLDANDAVILRIDVLLGCDPSPSSAGTLEAKLVAGLVISPVADTIPYMPQTVPIR